MFGFGSSIKSIQRGAKTLTTGNVSDTITISAVNTSKSVVLINFYTATILYYVAKVHVNAVLTNSTTVTVTRGLDGENVYIAWQVVEYR